MNKIDLEVVYIIRGVTKHELARMNLDGYKLFSEALRDMQPRSKLYELIRAEMTRRDHWKQKRRGKPGNPAAYR